MPNVYFNTETGQAENIERGTQALMQTADVYHRIKKHFTTIYRDYHNFNVFYIASDTSGFKYNIKACLPGLSSHDSDKVKLMLYGITRGSMLEPQNLELLDEWIVEQLDVHSPLMEYAAKQNGMLLTIAVTDDWKHDFFTFKQEASRKLPNLWGQKDISPFEQWLESWYEKYCSPLEGLFRNCGDLTICHRALPEDAFTSQEWRNIAQHFIRASKRNYAVDRDLIKNLLPHKTKYGPLHELRLVSDGIRILFSLREGKPIVGGYYRYGTGEQRVRDNNSKTATTRIDAHHY